MNILVTNAGQYEQRIKEVLTETPCTWGPDGLIVTLERCEEGVRVVSDGKNVTLYYSDLTSLFRGIGTVVTGEGAYDVFEKCSCRQLGNMVDCSRNAVVKVETVKRFCRMSALMGFHMLQLYTEDTYEIEGEPYFGHLRGRYTQEELREIDAYAMEFGIEVIPCIQTLAHMNAIFQWPAYAGIQDNYDILNVGLERSLELIEKMFITMRGALHSDQINIGMDEAHTLGRGKYLDQFGYRERAQIMSAHLEKVMALCRKYGYKPMMWSDMFFRICSPSDLYFAVDAHVTDEVRASVPEDVMLVMWNYYYEDALYENMCREHFAFKNKIAFAGGAANWMGFAPFQQYAVDVARGAAAKIREYPFETVFCTEWSNDGAETSFLAGLPSMAIYAESAWNGDTGDAALSRCMKRVSADFRDFMSMDAFSILPSVSGNFSFAGKYLFYSDILQGKWDAHVPEESEEHFAKAVPMFEEAAKRNPNWSYIFDSYTTLAAVLEQKAKLGLRLKAAYDSGDREEMRRIAEQVIPELVERVEAFLQAFKYRWETENKDFGFDIHEIRIGGLIYRLKGAAQKISGYLDGKTARIEELEQPRLGHRFPEDCGAFTGTVRWKDAATVSLNGAF